MKSYGISDLIFLGCGLHYCLELSFLNLRLKLRLYMSRDPVIVPSESIALCEKFLRAESFIPNIIAIYSA